MPVFHDFTHERGVMHSLRDEIARLDERLAYLNEEEHNEDEPATNQNQNNENGEGGRWLTVEEVQAQRANVEVEVFGNQNGEIIEEVGAMNVEEELVVSRDQPNIVEDEAIGNQSDETVEGGRLLATEDVTARPTITEVEEVEVAGNQIQNGIESIRRLNLMRCLRHVRFLRRANSHLEQELRHLSHEYHNMHESI